MAFMNINKDLKEEKRTILINGGFYHYKGENEVFFKTAIKECRGMGSSGDIIKYNGISYSVGQGLSPTSTNKTDGEITKICTLYMICKQIPKDDVGGDFHIILTAPPLSFNTEKTALPKYLIGEYNVTYNGCSKKINITSVDVYPETILALMAIRQELELKPNTIVIDIGGRTTTVVKTQKGNFGEGDIINHPEGMHFVESVLYNKLITKYHDQNLFNRENVWEVLTGEIENPKTNESIKCEQQSIIDEVFMEYFDKIKTVIENQRWIINSTYDIVLTGGGGKVFYPIISKHYFNNVCISQDPIFDNLKGLQMIKEAKGLI